MRRFNGYMHGIDIGGWLSQCDYSKEHLDNFITEEDIKRIKGWGCDHVRVPVDYNIFQDENGFIESGFDYVQKCIDWCGNNGINMILDLHKTMGFFFEAMCVRDLRLFAEALNGKVYHYRDKSGLECDAVVHLRNGQYGLIEVKLGGETLINEGVETLTSLAKQIDTTRMKAPAFKMILTATGEYAYRRPEDGIYIVPIGCLKQ